MKKILLSFFIFWCILLSANAAEIKKIEYKNIKPNTKLTYNIDIDRWTKKKRSNKYYYVKQVLINANGNEETEFYTQDNKRAFVTGCNYEFLHKGKLIGYSNQDLKFYDFSIIDDEVIRRTLSEEEVQELFPKFHIIKVSEFNFHTNYIKIKKDIGTHKLLILNDTNLDFEQYTFSSGNSKFNTYQLSGFIDIKKKGMIQFSHCRENTDIYPWYILLVR